MKLSLGETTPAEADAAASASPAAPAASLTVAGRAFPTNRGGLCKKGWTAAELLVSPDRILEPMVRQNDGTFAATSWSHALDLVAAKLRVTRAEYGADAVGVFGGGGLTNEKAYQLGKFTRVALGSSRIDYNGRFCMSSAAAAGNRAFGLDRGLPFRVDELDTADTILILGSNVAQTMPPFIGHLEGARAAGGLVVIDPRRTATARLTDDGAGMHVQPTPGSDLVLLLGLTHIVIVEKLVDRGYLANRTTGFDAVRRCVSRWWPTRVQEQTGVPVWQLRQLARRLAAGAARGAATGSGTYILTGRGVEQHADGTDTATAAINLSLVLGLVGTTHSGYGTLTGQGNGQGGREHGQKCDQLPGYRKINDPVARTHVAGVWGVDPDSLPGVGLPAVELLGALGEPGGIRCLLVHGSNIVVSAPNADQVRAALKTLDFLVVADFFFSDTAVLADVVLPVTQWAEEEGTMTSLEGRVIRRRLAVNAPEGVRSELWIWQELARRLDSAGTFSSQASEVFDELCRASKGGLADYSGLSYALLDTEEPVFWPYPVGSTGTPRLFLDRFAHPDGLARLVVVEARRLGAPAQVGGTLTLITGRLLEHYQSGTQTRRVRELSDAQPEARLQLHPATAEQFGISDEAWVEVSTDRGTVRCRAQVSTDIRFDTVFLPFHFSDDQRANLLTDDETDPVSGMPEFKKTTVRVRALVKAGAHV
ncbi:molybdopterin oxidoreductase family protein [Cryobacterium sp. Y29]|uniref:molybdopterin oxidoreductase family protein n=1 Tax=Cryobacterium sp. Y29 TaxID=2048285 RepID=UPI000CE4CB3E|nr:molybdopterin oxidoreductase family protein [Cryobacterium sp. Y29]